MAIICTEAILSEKYNKCIPEKTHKNPKNLDTQKNYCNYPKILTYCQSDQGLHYLPFCL